MNDTNTKARQQWLRNIQRETRNTRCQIGCNFVGPVRYIAGIHTYPVENAELRRATFDRAFIDVMMLAAFAGAIWSIAYVGAAVGF